jgi:hypothetical protein
MRAEERRGGLHSNSVEVVFIAVLCTCWHACCVGVRSALYLRLKCKQKFVSLLHFSYSLSDRISMK